MTAHMSILHFIFPPGHSFYQNIMPLRLLFSLSGEDTLDIILISWI